MLAILKCPSSSVCLHFSGSPKNFQKLLLPRLFTKLSLPCKKLNRMVTPSFVALVFFTDSQEQQGNKEESNQTFCSADTLKEK